MAIPARSDRKTPPPDTTGTLAPRRKASSRRLETHVADWMRPRVPRLAQEWSAEIRARGSCGSPGLDGVLDRQIQQLTSLLPWLLGSHGVSLLPLWTRAGELFGVVAARRGLAAGEVVEEFQILRTILIRDLYQDPPIGGAPSLREVLRLNRVIDRGVTHASVGHTDTMFFQLLEAADAPVGMTSEAVGREADVQLALIQEEVEAMLAKAVPDAIGSLEPWTAPQGGAADA